MLGLEGQEQRNGKENGKYSSVGNHHAFPHSPLTTGKPGGHKKLTALWGLGLT